RFFAFCREQTLCLKFCLQLLKRDLQSPGALWFQVLSRDLQFASVFINRHSPSGYNLHPVFWTKSQEPRRRPEHHDPNLRVLILERKIKCAGVGSSKIENSPCDPVLRVLPLNMRSARSDQSPPLPDPPIGWPERKSELI